MTFKIPAEEGGTSRLKEITVTKGNKSIIFNDTTEISIPSVALNTTLNTESITVGSDTLKVMTTDTDQTISGIKTFDSYPIIRAISNSDKSDSIASFNYDSTEGSSVASTGHFIAYGDDDSSNTLKPTTEYAEVEGADIDAYYFSTGITLFDAEGLAESVKLSYPSKSGTFALTSDVPVKLGDLTDRTADMLEEPANCYNMPTLTYRPFIYDTAGNRLYGILPSRVVVEESIDAGQTWTIKALTDVQKNSLFDNSNS